MAQVRYWYNPLVNIGHFGHDIYGSDGAGGGSSPATGTTGYLKRRGYVIGSLPIQTPDLARRILGTDGGGGGGSGPATGTTGFLKRAGYVLATLPIQTPDLLRRILGTTGATPVIEIDITSTDILQKPIDYFMEGLPQFRDKGNTYEPSHGRAGEKTTVKRGRRGRLSGNAPSFTSKTDKRGYD